MPSLEIKIPRERRQSVFSIGDKVIVKGSLRLVENARLSNTNGATTGVRANAAISVNRDSSEIYNEGNDTARRERISRGGSISINGTVQNNIADDVKIAISGGVNLTSLDEIFEKIVEEGQCSASQFTPLVSGLNTSLQFSNTFSLSLAWDSDLCFLTVRGTVPIEIRNERITFDARLQFGIHRSYWVRLFGMLAARYPNIFEFAIKAEVILNSMFGGRMVRIAATLRPFFAAILELEPFIWAIDIALAVRDLTLWEAHRRRVAGTVRGYSVSFGAAFTKTIFNYGYGFGSTSGIQRELQAFGVHYADQYHGERRISVQRYLASTYNNGLRIDNWREAQSVGFRFGSAISSGRIDSDCSPPARINIIRPSTNASYLAERDIIVDRINFYFNMNINRWVREYRPLRE